MQGKNNSSNLFAHSNQVFVCCLSVLATSLSYDVALPNGQSIRHPKVDQFIDGIRERFQAAISIYERTPLGKHNEKECKIYSIILANISGESVEIDPEARRALNYIETGT